MPPFARAPAAGSQPPPLADNARRIGYTRGMRRPRVTIVVSVMVVAGGCGGIVDPGDPVDHALACGTANASPLLVPQSAPEGPPPRDLVLGDFVPGPAAAPAGLRRGDIPGPVRPAVGDADGTQRTSYLNR